MLRMTKDKPIVISLGGSLIVPNGGFDIEFLSSFNIFIREKITAGWRFFIVTGGGSTARHYIDAAKKIVGDINNWNLDWIGIHTTRLNAHLIRTIFGDIAHPRVIHNYEKKIKELKQPLVVAAGWRPGCSTDYDATILARDYGAQVLINLSNIDFVYDKDPNKFTDARKIEKMTWDEIDEIVGKKWTPGKNVPFDPKAVKLAKKIGLTVYITGKKLNNLDNILAGRKFEGTIITSN